MAQTRPSPTLSRGFTRLGRFLAPYATGHEAAGGDREATPRWRVWLCARRVVSSLPVCPRGEALGVLVFGGVAPPTAPRVPRSRAASYLWPVPPYAVPRRTRRRGDAVRGAARPAVWGRRRAGTSCACCAR